MQRYIGVDAHAASCTLAIIAETGKRLRDFPCPVMSVVAPVLPHSGQRAPQVDLPNQR